MPFDRAYHVVTAGGRLFFGSSADCKVYALDMATGDEHWSFFTNGPIRFAPAVWKDRLFVTSDDGFLYCLATEDARLLWKLRGGPNDSMVLGNDRMTSRWPARGGPVVADGVVYFGAGIWPSEGIYLYALDAKTGDVLWCNDSSGGIYMGQPHGGANAKSGVSAQGHLVVADDALLVPTGRAVPAAFRRADGQFLYFHLQQNTKYGGSAVAAVGDVFFGGGAVFNVSTGARDGSIRAYPPALMAAPPDGLICWHDGKVLASGWVQAKKADRRGDARETTTLEESWSASAPYGGTSLVVAGQTAVSAGSGPEGFGVSTVDLASKNSTWAASVDGNPWGLAVATGRLLVSTDKGTIYCFAQREAARTESVEPSFDGAPYEDLTSYQETAKEIIRHSGVTDGYCVDLGCGDGALAYALARTTNLHIHAVDADPGKVAEAQRRLDAAGLYGVRVTVHEGDPTKTPLPDYFANLVVSGRSAGEGVPAPLDHEARRILRPYGGVACLGKAGAIKKTVRGAPEGAGAWTHQYCDPANTNCSTDSLVRGPLGMLWFTDLDFPMPSRHGRGRAPLFLDGRLFIQGMDAVLCVDAYNGRKLWYHPLPGIQRVYDGEHLMGTSGTGSNFCVTRQGLYVHTGKKCLRLDPATGKRLAEFAAPEQPDGEPGTWGVIACVGDTLIGTLANTEHMVTYRFRPGDMSTQYTESTLLFAMDAATCRLKWSYQPEHSIRNNAIAIGGGRVHLIDRPIAVGDRHREKKRGVPDPGDVHPPGTLVALDLSDGKTLWKTEEDVYGTVLALSEEYETLVMCYQDWRFKLASELGGKMTALDATSGKRRWEVKSNGVTRPIINGKTIYCQPGAWDLLTGQQKDFAFERSYGCNIPAGSRHLMVFRSATLGYLDLSGDYGTENYGGIRPGCWINALPAGGLVLMPDATDRCTCSYLIKASIALQPYGARSSE
jgi:outer membrane protein assembly factor BamB